ncbi:MAG TPA: ribosome silencing factor [Deltaproteobacteria bacterium]|nr:ribosome silencing factor [Deltaproteobacteria bacterium]
MLPKTIKVQINSENENSFELNTTEIDFETAIVDESDRTLVKRMLELLHDAKAEEIVFIDAHERSSLADYLLICQGRSQLHCRSIAQNVEYNLKQAGEISLGLEGEREGNWVLLDYGNIILHVFHPEIRRYYKLEELYSRRPEEVYAENSESAKYRN